MSRKAGLLGVQRWRGMVADEANEMQIERPKTDEGELLSALDLDEIGRPELLTTTPVKDGLVQELCMELEKLCVATSIRRHPENPDFALHIFELPAKGVRVVQQAAKIGEEIRLWEAPARRDPGVAPAPFATLAVGPPQDVLERSLMPRARLSWSGCACLPAKRSRSDGVRPRLAIVSSLTGQRQLDGLAWARREAHLNCWIQDVPESFLEVDLGGDCRVTHVSTMGRFPPTKVYPDSDLRREWAKVGEAGHQTWTVVDPGAPGWEQWVTRYELKARLDGGRDWVSIGVFKGNSDMTSEVSHDLCDFCRNPEGLRCRFLRFLPQGFHRKPAMRVGVYGVSLKEAAVASKPEVEERIRYLIPVPLNNRNQRRHQRDFVSRRRYSPDWYGKYGSDYKIARRRALRAKETCAQAREAMGAGARAVLLRQDSAASRSCGDAEGADAQAEQGADAQTEQPGLERATSLRVESVLTEPPALVRTLTDEQRGYCSEPEDVEIDSASSWQHVEEALQEPPPLVRTRTDEERGYCSEPEDLLIATSDWTML